MVTYKPSKREILYGNPGEKIKPYPVTTLEQAYIDDRHFEYIKYAYEPRTGEKRPDVMSEEDFNIQFDCEHL